jgi:hypothetical protein
MNIKPRTAFIAIAAVVGLIIIGQATKHDPAPMTAAEQKADAIYQHKRFHQQYCEEHNTCQAEQEAMGELADSVVRAQQR